MFPFQKTDWFTPTRKMNADDVGVLTFQRIFDRNSRGITSTAVTSLFRQSAICR